MSRRTAFTTMLIAAAALATVVLAAPASAQNITDKLNSWFFGPPARDNGPRAATAPEDLSCPDVEVREGAATLAINAPGGDPGPMNTRYQVSIGETARECSWTGPTIVMRVGVKGRVLLGPAGGPGEVDLPLRLAVVQEGPSPRPIIGKLVRLSVSVGPGQTAVPFVHIEQDLAFPTPSAAALDKYVIYVGFDPDAVAAKPERKAKAKKGPPAKRKPTQ